MKKRHVSIAGVRLLFETESAGAVSIVETRFGGFAVRGGQAEGETVFELDLHGEPPEVARQIELLAEATPGGGLSVIGDGVRADIAADALSVRLRGPMMSYVVDAVVRVVVARRLLARGALLLHSSSKLIDGRAYVFPGQSGAGKSTLARTLPGTILGDESVAVETLERRVIAHGTPWWTGTQTTAPVAAILFPGLGAEASWTKLSTKDGLTRLVAAAGPLPTAPAPLLLAAAARIAEHIRFASFTLASEDEINAWLLPRLASSL